MTAKVALIHDWLTGMRGGEKVLEVLCEIFPAADIFTLVHVPGSVSETIERHPIYTSPLQRVPGVREHYRRLLPLMPWAIEQFDFSVYNLLVSTSHCVAKGARPPPGAKHVCYCHTPMRYVWDQYEEYFGPGKAGALTRFAMAMARPYLQRWDVRTVPRVHQFVANSANVAERIQRIYGRHSTVLYPPVNSDFFCNTPAGVPAILQEYARDARAFYLIVSALAPYKRVDLAVDGFRKRSERLLIIGDGPERDRLRRNAPENVRFLGWQQGEALRWCYANCEALLFPGEEDFGIVPLEAMAAGRPVLAYAKGGSLETVVDGVTGAFFNEQTVDSLLTALVRARGIRWEKSTIQAHVQRFDRARCKTEFRMLFSSFL